jgi:hypothetical protein
LISSSVIKLLNYFRFWQRLVKTLNYFGVVGALLMSIPSRLNAPLKTGSYASGRCLSMLLTSAIHFGEPDTLRPGTGVILTSPRHDCVGGQACLGSGTSTAPALIGENNMTAKATTFA